MKVLVTGAAGFIGFHTAYRLLDRGDEIIGLDNLNDYYDPGLKRSRLDLLTVRERFRFVKMDLTDRVGIPALFKKEKFNAVIHLGAQAGVRHSQENPLAYVDSNLTGTTNVLEACRHTAVEHLVYASSSSVYGNHTALPFNSHQSVDHPISFYAATKKATELMAHSYSANYGLPTTGLRFFTVYGPWGRPDMALFKFTRSILAEEDIEVYNNGKHKRDFTYIDDAVSAIVGVVDHAAIASSNWDSSNPDPASSSANYRIYNVGNSRPMELIRYIELLETCLGKKAKKKFLPIQEGDMPETWADITDLNKAVGYLPTITIEVGIQRFVAWYLNHYGVR